MVLGRDHRVRTRAIGHTQTGPQVVGVGHAVQHQQQRRLVVGLQLVQQIVERSGTLERVDARRHALVAVAAGQLGNAQAVGLDHPRTSLLRPLQELAHALVTPRRIDIDLDDGLRRRLQAHADGMETEQDFGGG